MKQERNVTVQGFNPFRNQRGQSVVELVLVLIISISLLFLTKSLFTNTSDFMNRFMGDYVACLMEYGELPTLGVEDSTLKNHGGGAGGGKVCSAQFNKPETTASSGASGSTRSNGSGSSSNSSGKNSSGSASNSSSSSGSSDSQSSSSRSSRSSRNSSSSGSSSSSSNNSIKSDSAFATADNPANNSSKVKIIEDEEGAGSGRRARDLSASSSRTPYGRNAYRGLTGKMEAEIEKNIKKSTRVPSSQILSKTDDGYRTKNYTKTFMPPEAKATAMQDKEDGFSFGYLLRWLIIAGIVIAIIVLLGGQILNYSNSKDQ